MKKQNVKPEKNKKEEEKLPEAKFSSLLRFATLKDKIYMAIGTLCALLNGLSLPFFSLIFGDLVDSFSAENTPDDVIDNSWYSAKWMFAIGILSWFCSWIQMFTWIEAGERQTIEFRKRYLEALLKQDISWFDTTNPNTLASKIATDCFAIQGAIGEKVPTFIQTLSLFLGGFVVGFINGWELALILIAAMPFLVVVSTIYTSQMQTADLKKSESYTEASGITEQAINGIKTVKALNGQKYDENNYKKTLQKAYNTAVQYGFKIGGGLGCLYFVILMNYAIGLYFGSIFIGKETENDIYGRPYKTGDVIACFFAIRMGGFSLGQTAPCLKNFGLGKQACYRILQVIDHKPKISPSYEKGLKPDKIKGNIELKNVEFTYPSKKDVQVLQKINLQIKAGQKTALVGESGCGKSTIMQLIERFYDSDKGDLIIDNNNIKDLNLKWLRQNIGYVGQEPVLFATTIEQNLKFGKPDATKEEMIDALTQANAYDFVMNLQDKLQTFVGTSGSQLSGGQKQRLCIARAILKNPQILLLDEATSALDRTNERSIQQTLDQISKNRTTIVIAHRLSTEQNSDQILVIDHGKLIEQGTHETLIQKQGKYAALCQNQLQNQQNEEENQQQQTTYYQQNQVQKDQNLKIQDININNQNNLIEDQIIDFHKQKNLNEIDEKDLSLSQKKAFRKAKAAQDKQFLLRLKNLNKPERSYMIIGCIFSFINGLAFPMTGLVMAYMLHNFSKVSFMEYDDYREECDLLTLYFVFIALAAGISSVFQFAAWARVAEALTLKLRSSAFSKITRMPISWFDQKDNNPGTLASKIGTETQKVNALTSTVVNAQVSTLSCVISGIAIGFIYDWRTTLVSLTLFPIIMVASILQAQFTAGFSDLTDVAYRESGKIVSETVSNMRTVYSFITENQIYKSFEEKLSLPLSFVAGKAHKSGIAYGFSQLVVFVVFGLQFWIAALFAKEYGTDPLDLFCAIFGVQFAGFGAGNNSSFMGDIGAAQSAARNLFALIDSEDEIQFHLKTHPNPIKSGNLEGNIEFKNVSFKYPSRDKIVLKNVSFKINSGDKTAFVGPSGCGKSTIMQLLLRYYEPLGGEIFIDGKEIHQYDIDFLRSQLGVVNQEPILFLGTIKENIQYNTQNLTQKDIEQAAEQANAANFIKEDNFEVSIDNEENNMKDNGTGYDRQVGAKGSSLSGGQKQRIAIARAIIKQPKILLLDEATSALDTKNEQGVQESLDNIMKNKTTLAIAHRISTIKDSKNIFVMEDGNIVEQVNYEHLQSNKSYFYRLERGEQK